MLNRGGRCLVTYFLLNRESVALIDAGRSALTFRHRMAGYRTTNVGCPEEAISYDEQWVLALQDRCGLTVEEICYGSWCGREGPANYQDIVVASKG